MGKAERYKQAGVDLEKANLLVEIVRKYTQKLPQKGVISEIGGYAGFFSLDVFSYKEPVLVSSTDGVGTKIKIVFIDEADYLSQNAQASLRGMTERYHEVGRFIFTANYISKFIDPLISRCQTFEFKKLPKDYLQNFCKDILNKENIKFDDVSVDKVITTFYPDVRRIVGILQSRTTEGELIIKTEDITSKEKLFRSYFTDVIVGVNNSDNNLIGVAVQKMLKIFEETELDYVSLYQEMFDDTNIPAWAKIVINKYSNNHVNAMIPAMNVMAMVYESITAGKQLRNLKR